MVRILILKSQMKSIASGEKGQNHNENHSNESQPECFGLESHEIAEEELI
jgi:hypothetical protein